MDSAREGLIAGAAEDLDAYRASYEGSCDLSRVPQANIDAFGRLFEDGKRRLGAERTALRIRSFMDGFKRDNASRIIDLLTPPTPEANPAGGQAAAGDDGETPVTPRPPQTRTAALAGLSVRGYGKPTIRTREDVDAYLAALRAELEAKVDDGIIVTR